MAGEKVAILTTFQEFLPGYSLTGIVSDQVVMLSRYGYEVHLFVSEKYHGDTFTENVVLEKKIPFTHLIDYKSEHSLTEDHKALIKSTAEFFVGEFADYKYIFTHDFIFTGWFLPYGMACVEASRQLPDARWFHWIHSVPTAGSDWWDIRRFGNRHKLVYPNRTDALRVAEQYRGTLDSVIPIPHIKDLRTWFDFDPETIKFIDDYPAVMQSHIVQVYPASVDRLTAKRLDVVIKMFASFKKRHLSVCLVVANQWATGTQQKQDINKYKKIAEDCGLIVGTEVVFTSDWQKGKYDVGLPKHILRELMMCMNIFIFPTREESFGLVLPEASLSSGCLCVVNKSLTMQLEVSGMTTLAMDFGSYHMQHSAEDPDAYYYQLALVCADRLHNNEGLLTKTHMRMYNNMDYLYSRYYAPAMAGSVAW